MRLLGYALAAVVAAAAAPVMAAPSSEPEARPGRLVRLPDGRRLNFRCAGTGSPTVLLEGGYAATSAAWARVMPLAAGKNRVCAYDRAGYGYSDPGPLPRDGAAIARDLDHGLRAARISGPFVVVGHSAGALYVRLFADRRPRDVVGMVLLDPSVEHQDRRFAAMFGPGAGNLTAIRDRDARCLAAAERGALPSQEPGLERCVPAEDGKRSAAVNAARRAAALRPATWRTQVSELDNLWSSTSDQLDAGRASYGDMPLIVLTAGGTYAKAPDDVRQALGDLWWGLHRELARRSTRGVSRRVEDSSHLMMVDKPDVVATAITEVVAAAKMLNKN